MTLDNRGTIVYLEGDIGSSSSRATIDYPTYLGTTWSILISVRTKVSNMDVVVDYDYPKHATYMSLSYSPKTD